MSDDLTTLPRPTVKLVGEDGNAFAIIGRCRRAARRAGWSSDDIEAFTTEATSGDYDRLLATVMRYFDDAEIDAAYLGQG